MIAAIHQPNHLPWTGFWLKFAAADTWIAYDDCELSKKGVTRRVSLPSTKGGQGDARRWSTLPLCAHRDSVSIDEVRLCLDTKAVAKLKGVLDATYGHLRHYGAAITPFLGAVEEINATTTLAEFNTRVICAYASALCLHTQVVSASRILAYAPGPTHLRDLVEAQGASIYLSGSGGARRYLTPDVFADSRVSVAFVDFYAWAQSMYESHHSPGHSFIGPLASSGFDAFRQNLTRLTNELRGRIYADINGFR